MKSTQHPRNDKAQTPLADDAPNSVGGPRDEGLAVISLGALIAMEEEASDAWSAVEENADGLIDFSAPWTEGDQGYTGYVGVFPFGTPTETAAFDVSTASMPFDVPSGSPRFSSSSELTPLPFEMSFIPPATERPRPALRRYGALGLLAAAAAALVLGLGAPRDVLQASAQGGLSQAARSIETRLPRVEVSAPITAARETPRKGAKDKKGSKKRHGVRGGGRPTPQPIAAESEPPAPQASPRPASPGDPCNGDLACAMNRATGN